ncbi:MAG: aminotransferase class I/II-fold pyridoxal phosphate-dependent enzyme [Myxococcales bacterium]|nr:aminotransferase class I/II-fold pyridoxal phosphate-dependent enzyme [Myxococcales bacterium]
MARLHLSPPHLAGTEAAMVAEALASNWIAPLGPHVDAFEKEFSAACGGGQTLALASGTAALHLALLALGVRRDDYVLCSDMTFAASANAIAYVGARPVFIDCDASWTMSPALLEEAIMALRARGGRIGAVLAVDLYGQLCDYAALREICARHGVPLVQDAAEALGSQWRESTGAWVPAGLQGELSVFSFNGNKIITTSGGGMLMAASAEQLAFARKLSTQAREPAPHYQHEHIGYNYRLSNLLAAVGRAQLAVLGERVARRRAIRARYAAALADVPGLSLLSDAPWCRGNAWLTCLVIDPTVIMVDREHIRLALEAADIESRPLWKPMHLQPVFAGCEVFGGAYGARLFDTGLCLPSGSSMSDGDVDRVVTTLLAALKP